MPEGSSRRNVTVALIGRASESQQPMARLAVVFLTVTVKLAAVPFFTAHTGEATVA